MEFRLGNNAPITVLKGQSVYVPANHTCRVIGSEPAEFLIINEMFDSKKMLSDMDKNGKQIVVKNLLNGPEESRPMNELTLNFAKFTDEIQLSIGRFQPGWRWAQHVKPIVKTDACEHSHVIFGLEGQMGAYMAEKGEGQLRVMKPYEACLVPPKHDGYVVGNDEAIALDFGSFVTYGKAKEELDKK